MPDIKNIDKKEASRLKRLIGRYREAVRLKTEVETYKNSVESIKQQVETVHSSISYLLTEAQKVPERLTQITIEGNLNKS